MSQKIALVSLDFPRKESVCGGEREIAMDPTTVEPTLKIYLTEMRERLEQAAGIAKAAEACAENGSVANGIELALDVEQLIYEVSTFLDAASMIHRLSKS